MADQKSLTLTRVINAPPDIVFDAWTDPKQLAEWWGPEGFTNPVCEADARPGGEILIHMRGPDGRIYPMKGTFIEVKRPSRIEFRAFAHWDETSGAMMEVKNSVTLEEDNGKTKLTLNAVILWAKPEAAPAIAGMDAGWSSSLVRLAAFVEGIKK